MLAAILVGQKRPLVVADLKLPPLGPGQVLVDVHAASICGQQLDELAGNKGPDRYLPHLLGHEGSGIVEEIGQGVTTVKPGDRVVLHWRKSQGLESTTPTYMWADKKVNAGWVTTFQEKSVVSENRLTVIPPNVDFEIAALYGCCVTTAFGVIQNDAKLNKGESLVVYGTGGLGMVEVLSAKLQGADPIVAIDRYDWKLDLAKRYGATHVINADKSYVFKETKKIVGDRGADVVIENTGIGKVIEQSYELTAPQGRTILVGVPHYQEKTVIDTLPLHFGKILTGSHGGDAVPDRDIPMYLGMQEKGMFDLMPIITHRFRLDEINDAFKVMREGKALRTVIRMKS